MISAIILVLTLVQVPPNGKIGNAIAWDHDGINTNHYEANFDNDPTWINTALVKQIIIPNTITLGQHTIYVRACRDAASLDCSDSASFTFNIISSVSVVTNLHIIIIPTPVIVR